MGNKLVSIVVPVYNPGEYLVKCVESIINQTYRNLEIILVDDGSADGSGEKCQAYALQDTRVKVIHQSNQGVVSAKTNGVRASKGDLIGYVDSDDYIEEDYIEQLVKLQEQSGADIVAVGHFHDIGSDSTIVKNGICNGVYNISDIMDKALYAGDFFEYGITPLLCTKLFRTDLLRAAQMAVPELIAAGDDAAVFYPCLVTADRICVSDAVGYHYVQHSGSVTKTVYSDETKRIESLLQYLRNSFDEKGVLPRFERQLKVYENYLLALRQIEVFDAGKDVILTPYGGIHRGEKVVVYGSGVLGQKIVKYLNADGGATIVSWVDRNYVTYRKNGLQVDAPEKVKLFANEYDYILIANITEKTAMSIKKNLISMGVLEDKIRWFSESFRGRKDG